MVSYHTLTQTESASHMSKESITDTVVMEDSRYLLQCVAQGAGALLLNEHAPQRIRGKGFSSWGWDVHVQPVYKSLASL